MHAGSGLHAEFRSDELRDLDGVEGCALAQVVIADEQHETLAFGSGLIGPDPADEARIPAGGLQRRRPLR